MSEQPRRDRQVDCDPSPPGRTGAAPNVVLASAAELAAAVGVAEATVRRWHFDRERTGHPEAAATVGRERLWNRERWLAWHQEHQQRIADKFTRPDPGGDPDALLDAGEVARLLGYASHRSVLAYLRRPGYFPDPDHVELLGSGACRRRWRRCSVLAWAADRGRRYVGSRSEKPYAPHC